MQIGNAAAFIDADGRLTHNPTRDQLAVLFAEQTRAVLSVRDTAVA
ncbi:hypothetical protein [Streptomyces sp. NPDC000880]